MKKLLKPAQEDKTESLEPKAAASVEAIQSEVVEAALEKSETVV